jgi:MarR family transcriptional repressor of emrRAB
VTDLETGLSHLFSPEYFRYKTFPMPLPQLQHIEERLRKLAAHEPNLPATETLILRAVNILGRDFNVVLERQLKPAGLSEAEFRMLIGLKTHDGHASAGDLCAALAQSPANLTRISDALVERGYVSRSPDTEDRRRMLLRLEPAGQKILSALLPQIFPDISAVFAAFSATEMLQLLESLKKLMAGVDALQASTGAPPEENS